jgi:cold-inducible RNA-binding protein
MSNKLYVGNLPFSTTAEELQALFHQAGEVASVEVIKDRETGNSKGFAFIEMGSQVEAEKAISVFNGYSMGNRQLKVNIARPREERPVGGWYTDGPGNPGKSKRRSSGSRPY